MPRLTDRSGANGEAIVDIGGRGVLGLADRHLADEAEIDRFARDARLHQHRSRHDVEALYRFSRQRDLEAAVANRAELRVDEVGIEVEVGLADIERANDEAASARMRSAGRCRAARLAKRGRLAAIDRNLRATPLSSRPLV